MTLSISRANLSFIQVECPGGDVSPREISSFCLGHGGIPRSHVDQAFENVIMTLWVLRLGDQMVEEVMGGIGL